MNQGGVLPNHSDLSEPPVDSSSAWGGYLIRLRESEKARFLVVGGFNTVFGYSAFVVIYFFFRSAIGYLGTLLCAHIIASSLAFVLYRRMVFRVRGRVLLDFLRFQSVYAASLGVNLALLPAFVELLGWNVYFSQAMTLIVTLIGSYLGHKFFSFRRPGNSDPLDSVTRSNTGEQD